MRTSLGDHLVTLRRPAALAALAAASGGWIGVRSPTLALWSLTARVQALDTTGDTTVTTMPGGEATPVVWVAVVAGLVVIVVAAAVALDRPPQHARTLMLFAAAALLIVTLMTLALRPEPAAFAQDPKANDLVVDDATLPTGVAIDLLVRPGLGLWVLGASGLLVAAGAVVADRSG